MGSTENAPENEVYDRDIDLKNDLIIPGFCNAHTHSPMVSCAPLRRIFRWTDG